MNTSISTSDQDNTKEKSKDMCRWVEGVVMTIYESYPGGTGFTRTHITEEINTKHGDKDWADLHPMIKTQIIERVMTQLSRKKFVIGVPTYGDRLYHVTGGTLKRKV